MNKPEAYNKAVIPNSSFMTNELSANSPIAIGELQNNDNQAVVNSAIDCRIERLQADGLGHLHNHSRNAGRTTESFARY